MLYVHYVHKDVAVVVVVVVISFINHTQYTVIFLDAGQATCMKTKIPIGRFQIAVSVIFWQDNLF